MIKQEVNAPLICLPPSSTGPGWLGTDPNAKGALSGDINVCGCNPPPIFHAERQHAHDLHERASGNADRTHPKPPCSCRRSVTARMTSNMCCAIPIPVNPWPVRYRIRTASGQVFSGVIDSAGYTPRVTTTGAEALQLHIYRDHV